MKKLQIVFLTLVAVCAFSAIAAASASAEATLAAEWLASGAKITAELVASSTGELLLEDEGAASSVLCTGVIDEKITVLPGGGVIVEILRLADTVVTLAAPLLGTGAGSDCVAVKGCAEGSTASPIEVSPLGLPWSTLLFLDETTGLFLKSISATEVGYELTCLVLGVKVEDKCTQTNAVVEVVNDADTGDAAIPANAIGEPRANCSIGGTSKGKNEADVLTPMLLESGELLTVSE